MMISYSSIITSCYELRYLNLLMEDLRFGSFILFRYWNDREVLKKLGEAMGFAVSGEGAASAEIPVTEETEDAGNEDESIVHQTASVGDVEV